MNMDCVLLSMDFIVGVGGLVDSWGENFHYRYMDAMLATQMATLPATCHTPHLPTVAYAFFAGLVSSPEELLDSVGARDDTVPGDDFGPDPASLQLAAVQV